MKSSLVPKTLLTLLSGFCLAPALHAAPILFENFDQLTPAATVTSAGAFGAINGTNVDIVGGLNGSFFANLCAGPESGNCVDLGGSGGNAVGQLALATPLNLAAGTYNLSFDLIGSGRGQTTSTTVSFGDYTHTFVLGSSDQTSGVVVNQLVNVAGGSTQLMFTNNGGGDQNVGALLDNVSINPSSTAVTPEPGTLALLGTGAMGVFGSLRRRIFSRS